MLHIATMQSRCVVRHQGAVQIGHVQFAAAVVVVTANNSAQQANAAAVGDGHFLLGIVGITTGLLVLLLLLLGK